MLKRKIIQVVLALALSLVLVLSLGLAACAPNGVEQEEVIDLLEEHGDLESLDEIAEDEGFTTLDEWILDGDSYAEGEFALDEDEFDEYFEEALAYDVDAEYIELVEPDYEEDGSEIIDYVLSFQQNVHDEDCEEDCEDCEYDSDDYHVHGPDCDHDH